MHARERKYPISLENIPYQLKLGTGLTTESKYTTTLIFQSAVKYPKNNDHSCKAHKCLVSALFSPYQDLTVLPADSRGCASFHSVC
jgi:hypothetical protein